MKTFFANLLMLSLLLFWSHSAAANLIEYNLAGAPGNQLATPPSFVAPNLNGLSLTRSPGLGLTSSSLNSMNSNNWSVGQFYSFGFTVAPTYQVNLSQLQIGTRASDSGPRFLGVYTSVDNFTTPIATIVHGNGSANFGFVNSLINLSSFTGLTGTVEIRLRLDTNLRVNASSAIAATGTVRVTNYFVPVGDPPTNPDTGGFRILGSVSSVPEPASLLLFGLATVSMVFLRRR